MVIDTLILVESGRAGKRMNNTREILLIDDDAVDVMAIRRSLLRREAPPRLLVAKDGIDALKLLDQGDVSEQAVVFLDLNMPRMPGLHFLQMLRAQAQYRHLKVWVMTTSDDNQDELAARELGVEGFLRKTFQSADIDAFVSDVLEAG
ncbi:MAG: response regulator [Pseudomonadota bacterium]|nr:response regulator [Pseudomonadota bacterium]MEC8104300.1 response regulator [Pseudomonadota bacterium]MEC8522835.1 response regulator [Pseudomonadota bacterium]